MITNFQRNNLKKLASFLEKNFSILNFDMDDYTNLRGCGYTRPKAFKLQCGTVACAAGHGPTAGIRATIDDINWSEYTSRVFTNNDNDIWAFLFSSAWAYFDNTPLGAAARIRYFLDHEDTIDDYAYSTDVNLYKDYVITPKIVKMEEPVKNVENALEEA